MSESPVAVEPAVAGRTDGGTQSGVRSGALLGAANAAAIVANYVFLLAAARILGSDGYGSLAALFGLLAVVLLPAGALQLAVSREISRRIARGDREEADAFARAAFRLALVGTVPLMVLALVLAYPLDALLNIGSIGIVLLTETTLVGALVAPVAMGVLQGQQRFKALAALYVLPFVPRLALLAVLAAAGYHLGGVVLASVAAMLAAAVATVALIRHSLRSGAAATRPDLGPFLRYLGLVAAGVIGIALLTHIDLLIVKARFSSDDAGAYGAASAFARVAFFLPATILAVLFPRTAARQARGEETRDILGRSLLATAAFCSALAVFYLAAGEGLVATTFGTDFSAGGRVLPPFALAIGLFSLANVLVGYHLSRGERRYAWIVAAGVVVQVTVLALVPTSLRGVVWSNVAVGVALIVAHELFVGSSVPALRAGIRHFSVAAGGRLRGVTAEVLLALGGAAAFVSVLMWPVVRHLSSIIVGRLGSDSTASVGWFWQLDHEGGYHLLGSTHHTLTAAPFGWDQGNGLNVQWLLPYYPGYLLTKLFGEIAAYNLVTLSGYALSGAAMYLLARYLGCVRPVAAWAALVYIVFPWHLARIEHASLDHLEVLVLVLLALIAAARRPGWPRFALVGAATLACWLTSGYFGAEAFVTAGAFAVGAALALDRRRGALLVVGATASALAGTAIVGMASYLSGVNAGAGLHRAAEDLSNGGLRLTELVVPAPGNIVLGDRLASYHNAHLHSTFPTEVSNYLGLLTIALALTWLVHAWRHRDTISQGLRAATAGLSTAAVTGILFALPSPVVVFGYELWMPSRVLWEVIPAFRGPARWVPLIMAAVLPLAALGLQLVWSALAASGRRPRLLPVAAVGAAMVFSFLELAIEPAKTRFRTGPVPPEYAAVEQTPKGILAEYPLGSSDVFRFWQRHHRRRLLNPVITGDQADTAHLVLEDPATPGTASALALLGVTSIVVHEHAVADVDIEPRTPTAGDGYQLVDRFPGGTSVWNVVARPAAALVTLPGGFEKPKRQADGAVGFALSAGSGVGSIELTAKQAGIVRLVLDATPPPGKTSRVRIADASAEQPFELDGRTRISLLVEVPRGRSQLLLKVDPPPTSVDDAIVLSALRAEHGSGEPVLHAQSVSPNPGF